MGVDVNVIFQIAGVGIVVAFLHTILDQMGKKSTHSGSHCLDLSTFYLWLLPLWMICLRRLKPYFYFKDRGGLTNRNYSNCWTWFNRYFSSINRQRTKANLRLYACCVYWVCHFPLFNRSNLCHYLHD